MVNGHENLKPAQPGEIRNPNGRPKGSRSLTTLLREMLELTDDSGLTNSQRIVKKLILKANTGNDKSIEQVFDRTEGKALQRTKLEGEINLSHDDFMKELKGRDAKPDRPEDNRQPKG